MDLAGGDRGAAERQRNLKLDEAVKLAKVLSAGCGGAEGLEAGESTLEKHGQKKLRPNWCWVVEMPAEHSWFPSATEESLLAPQQDKTQEPLTLPRRENKEHQLGTDADSRFRLSMSQTWD